MMMVAMRNNQYQNPPPPSLPISRKRPLIFVCGDTLIRLKGERTMLGGWGCFVYTVVCSRYWWWR